MACASTRSENITKEMRGMEIRDDLAGGDRDTGFTNMILPSVRTRPMDPLTGMAIDKKGQGGNTITCMTNYIAVNTRPNFKIYQYHVSFQPLIDSKRIRQHLVRDRKDLFGDNPVFDGMILYQGNQFHPEPLVLTAVHPLTEEKVTITVKLTKELGSDDPQCLTILNLCNRRIFEMLGFVQLGRNYYSPDNIATIEDFKMEIWPGMVSAIRCHEHQLLLVCEMSHKILRTDTVLDLLKRTLTGSGGQEQCMQELIGCSVLTRYNNKTYRIDDVMWDMTPKDTFQLENGREMSFAEYYLENYNKKISDLAQPLLMSRGKRKATESVDAQPIYLVPELCAMTGLTDAMRENRKIMQSLAQHTRVPPVKRIQHARNYLNAMNGNSNAKELFAKWGIELGKDVLKIPARELQDEEIFFGGNRSVKYNRAESDWSRDIRMQRLDDARPLSKWLIVFAPSTKAAAEEFYRQVQVLGPKSGVSVIEPLTCQTQDETVRGFLEGIRAVVTANSDVQIVVAMVPNDNKTRYDAIKKACCLELKVPSQVIKARSLEKNTISVCSKILLQMNCKIGGSLWRVALPLKNTMIVGYDLYTDSSSKNKKVGAAVFSLNDNFTKWYSQCAFHGQASELVANLGDFCKSGLRKYQKVNGQLPERIILFRDGVGDGHIPVVFKDEIPLLQQAFVQIGGDKYDPRFAFVIVTKRVHSRYFKTDGASIMNPNPGTVVDDMITRPERYDFYLVPQSVRQGTVTPVSYNVIYDTSGLSATQMQRVAYKLCHMYYNWQGTIRVPAPCQFAHKLAFLVGQTLHEPVEEELADKLFFL